MRIPAILLIFAWFGCINKKPNTAATGSANGSSSPSPSSESSSEPDNSPAPVGDVVPVTPGPSASPTGGTVPIVVQVQLGVAADVTSNDCLSINTTQASDPHFTASPSAPQPVGCLKGGAPVLTVPLTLNFFAGACTHVGLFFSSGASTWDNFSNPGDWGGNRMFTGVYNNITFPVATQSLVKLMVNDNQDAIKTDIFVGLSFADQTVKYFIGNVGNWCQ